MSSLRDFSKSYIVIIFVQTKKSLTTNLPPKTFGSKAVSSLFSSSGKDSKDPVTLRPLITQGLPLSLYRDIDNVFVKSVNYVHYILL
jgi:hypothetical protein